MPRKLRILAGTSEAGGAECLLPVILHLREKAHEVYAIAGTNANYVFRNRQFPVDESISSPSECPRAVGEAAARFKPDIILSGLLGQKNNIDYSLIRCGRERGIPVLSILDSWMNYGDRVFDPDSRKKNGLLPDRIAVMDEIALREMVSEGVPSEACVITGHPKLDTLREVMAGRSGRAAREERLRRMGLPVEKPVIVFYSQPLSQFYPERYLGYDERDAIEILFAVFKELHAKTGVSLIFKEHPRYPSLNPAARLSCQGMVCESYADSDDLMALADVVISMSSTMLVYAAALGIPTVSLQPNLVEGRDLNVVTRAGLYRPVTSIHGLKRELESILAASAIISPERVPSWLRSDGRASERVESLIHVIIEERLLSS